MGKPVFDALLTDVVYHDHLFLAGTSVPNLTVDGQMEVAIVGGTASVYWRQSGTTYFVAGTPVTITPPASPVSNQLVGIFPPLTYPT